MEMFRCKGAGRSGVGVKHGIGNRDGHQYQCRCEQWVVVLEWKRDVVAGWQRMW